MLAVVGVGMIIHGAVFDSEAPAATTLVVPVISPDALGATFVHQF